MPTDDFTPDLSKLEQDYQILTELHRSPDSRTYLARHLELNRDVTITVVRGDSGAAAKGGVPSLSRFAGDVERLKTSRHPNVIPVIEGRWLGDGTYAVVRARARGATLDQLVTATGAMQTARVASALEQVQSALDWARDNAISNRSVDPSSMIFQQGSGRVLLSFEPRLARVADDECEDARLIGRLGWEMLAGKPFTAGQTTSLAALRPDLSPEVVSETDGLMRCVSGSTPNIGAYLALLSGTTPAAAPEVAPVAAAVVPAAVPAAVPPVGESRDAVVVQKRGWGFGTRFAVGVAVLATVAILAFVFLHPSSLPVVSRTAAGGQQTTAGQAAGDVAPNAGQPDTAAVGSTAVPYPASQFSAPAPNPGVTAYPQSPAPMPMPSTQPAAPVPAPMPTPIPSSTPAPTMSSTMPETAGPPPTPLAPPTTRRHEPLTTTPPVHMRSDDSMRSAQDSMLAKQDSAWASLDRALRVHSVTTKPADSMHTIPPVAPPVTPVTPVTPPVDTVRHTPPDSVRTGPSATTRPIPPVSTIPPPDTSATSGGE